MVRSCSVGVMSGSRLLRVTSMVFFGPAWASDPCGKAEMLKSRTRVVLLNLACPGRGRLARLDTGNRFSVPGNAPNRPLGHACDRTGPSGHTPPRSGCGPHAQGPPRSLPGDDRSPHLPSPESWSVFSHSGKPLTVLFPVDAGTDWSRKEANPMTVE